MRKKWFDPFHLKAVLKTALKVEPVYLPDYFYRSFLKGAFVQKLRVTVPVLSLCAIGELFAAESEAAALSSPIVTSPIVTSPVVWGLVAIVFLLIVSVVKDRLKIRSLIRLQAMTARLPIQWGVCDERGNIFFHNENAGHESTSVPKTIKDLNIELYEELNSILPSVFESNDRKSIEFSAYSTQYKIDLTPLSKKDFGVPAVLWIVHDVSDLANAYSNRMQMFELLQNTIRSIDDAVISTNCDGEITLANPSALRMIGLKQADVRGKAFDDVFPLKNEAGESLINQVMLTRNSFPFHSQMKVKDRNPLFVNGLITPIIEDQIISGSVLYFHDTTDLVQKEQKLQLALEYAQVSDRVKSDFLATVCHEFRSSINVIIGYCDLDSADSKGDRYPNIRNIHDEAEKLLTMFNDILDISKNNLDLVQTEAEPVNLNVFTRELQRIFSRTSGIKKVPLVVHIDPKVPVILSDYKGLRQVLMQLLTQAYSLVSGDSALMEINWEDQNLLIKISVDSKKVWLDQEKNFSVFDRLCERLNGGLNIEQRREKLSFEVFLTKPKIVGSAIPLTLPNLGENAVRPKKEIVLLVDDIAINLKLLAAMLKMLHIESVSCATAQDAIEEITQYEPLAIFMDLWMPDIGGEELAKALSQDPNASSIPRILMTADTQLDPTLEELFLCIIYKPLKPVDVEKAITLIRQRRGEPQKSVRSE